MTTFNTEELCAIPQYLDWIDTSKLTTNRLFYNPSAIHIIENYLFEINKLQFKYPEIGNTIFGEIQSAFCEFPDTHQHLLKKYVHIFGYDKLSQYCNDIAFLTLHIDDLNWSLLSGNQHAMPLLIAHKERIDWEWLSYNPAAIDLLLENYDRICWRTLSHNPAAIHILKQNMDRIDWYGLSQNSAAIYLMMANPDKIDWSFISRNPMSWPLVERFRMSNQQLRCAYPECLKNINEDDETVIALSHADKPWAIDIVKKQTYYVPYYLLSANPAIFTTDYLTPSRKRMELIRGELLSVALRPERVAAWRATGVDLSYI